MPPDGRGDGAGAGGLGAEHGGQDQAQLSRVRRGGGLTGSVVVEHETETGQRPLRSLSHLIEFNRK